jgi:hypothetical protein
MHAQYQHNRDAILHACLQRELDGFLADAHACLMSDVHMLGQIRTNGAVIGFLRDYEASLLGRNQVADLDLVQPAGVRWLAAFHLTVARPLARQYSSRALANLASVAPSSPEQPPSRGAALSRCEEIRLFRALYRYETYHHLFGRNQAERCGRFSPTAVNNRFFCLFDPWEVEAIGCIDLFARWRWREFYPLVKKELAVKCRSGRHQVPPPPSRPHGPVC